MVTLWPWRLSAAARPTTWRSAPPMPSESQTMRIRSRSSDRPSQPTPPRVAAPTVAGPTMRTKPLTSVDRRAMLEGYYRRELPGPIGLGHATPSFVIPRGVHLPVTISQNRSREALFLETVPADRRLRPVPESLRASQSNNAHAHLSLRGSPRLHVVRRGAR